jgi:hypothetical protein
MQDIERQKFSLAPHPIEREKGKRRLEPTEDWHANAVKAKREILKHANGAVFRKVLEETEAKELIERIGSECDESFIHDFRSWIAGIGKRSDYVRAGVPLSSVGQGKPISRDKEVIGFIDKLTGRVIDYYAEIANMKMRGPGVAANGGPAKLKDLWNYFKYVVRNEPINPEDFAYYREPVDNALTGNQEGIVDSINEAPSLRNHKRSLMKNNREELLKRDANEDAQSKKKETPKEQAKDVSGTTAPEVKEAAAAGASLAPPPSDALNGGSPPLVSDDDIVVKDIVKNATKGEKRGAGVKSKSSKRSRTISKESSEKDLEKLADKDGDKIRDEKEFEDAATYTRYLSAKYESGKEESGGPAEAPPAAPNASESSVVESVEEKKESPPPEPEKVAAPVPTPTPQEAPAPASPSSLPPPEPKKAEPQPEPMIVEPAKVEEKKEVASPSAPVAAPSPAPEPTRAIVNEERSKAIEKARENVSRREVEADYARRYKEEKALADREVYNDVRNDGRPRAIIDNKLSALKAGVAAADVGVEPPREWFINYDLWEEALKAFRNKEGLATLPSIKIPDIGGAARSAIDIAKQVPIGDMARAALEKAKQVPLPALSLPSMSLPSLPSIPSIPSFSSNQSELPPEEPSWMYIRQPQQQASLPPPSSPAPYSPSIPPPAQEAPLRTGYGGSSGFGASFGAGPVRQPEVVPSQQPQLSPQQNEYYNHLLERSRATAEANRAMSSNLREARDVIGENLDEGVRMLEQHRRNAKARLEATIKVLTDSERSSIRQLRNALEVRPQAIVNDATENQLKSKSLEEIASLAKEKIERFTPKRVSEHFNESLAKLIASEYKIANGRTPLRTLMLQAVAAAAA